MNLFDQCVKTMEKVVELQKPLYMESYYYRAREADAGHSVIECGTVCGILDWMALDLDENDPRRKAEINDRASMLWGEFSDLLENNNLPTSLSNSMFAAYSVERYENLWDAIHWLRNKRHPLADILEKSFYAHPHLKFDEYNNPDAHSFMAFDYVVKMRDILNPYLVDGNDGVLK